MRALQRENIRWFTETDVSVAQDDELLALMRDAGCAQVLIGFESTSRGALAGIELKSDWKARRFDEYRRAIDKIQGYGITVNGCFVLGMDNDSRGCFRNVLQFVRDTSLYDVQITMLTAFPGTPLFERLKREGRLLDETAWELCTLFDANFEPKHMTPDELESEFRWLVTNLYEQEFTEARHDAFRQRQVALRRQACRGEDHQYEHHYG